MTETYICPVDGCDFEGPKGSFEGHLSALEDHPNPSEMSLEDHRQADEGPEKSNGSGADEQSGEQTKDPDEGPKQGPEGGSPADSTADDPEQASEQDEPGEKGENDHPEKPAMPTDEELDRQRNQLDEGPEQGDSDTPERNKSTLSAPSSAGIGSIPIPVSTTTLAIGAGLVLMVALLYLHTRDSGSGADVQETIDDSPDEQDSGTGGGGFIDDPEAIEA